MALRRARAGAWSNLRASKLLETYGGVKVDAKNMIKLLDAEEAVMLFPGGIREVRVGWWMWGKVASNSRILLFEALQTLSGTA